MASPSSSSVEQGSPSILIVGGTGTGKSHYGAQLLRRLQKRQGELQMVETPDDLSAYQEVLDQLALGRSAGHTPSNVYRESVWHVRSRTTGHESRLVWPDYAGEQVQAILDSRHVTEAWVHRLKASEGWLFLIRPSAMASLDSILSRPRAFERMKKPDAEVQPNPEARPGDDGDFESHAAPLSLCNQAGLVELLQGLLFARQEDLNRRLRRPALVVALTCWDEVSQDSDQLKPSTFLRNKFPLLGQFLQANWAPEALTVLGLSALGKPLKNEVSDTEFAEDGPERHGWCMTDDGAKSTDLTLPLALLMQKLHQ